jgi:hypothetical protein
MNKILGQTLCGSLRLLGIVFVPFLNLFAPDIFDTGLAFGYHSQAAAGMIRFGIIACLINK